MAASRKLRHRSPTRAASVPAKRRARQPAIAGVIATRLEEDIVLGRRHPRERLIEQDLCEQFNTHRADVRLAFFELEKKGIIQRIPNRGAIVRDLTPSEVTEIYAVREELEVMAVRILPFPVVRSEIDKLDDIQRKHSAAIDSGDLLTVFIATFIFTELCLRCAAMLASSRQSNNSHKRSTASVHMPMPSRMRSIARGVTMST